MLLLPLFSWARYVTRAYYSSFPTYIRLLKRYIFNWSTIVFRNNDVTTKGEVRANQQFRAELLPVVSFTGRAKFAVRKSVQRHDVVVEYTYCSLCSESKIDVCHIIYIIFRRFRYDPCRNVTRLLLKLLPTDGEGVFFSFYAYETPTRRRSGISRRPKTRVRGPSHK